MKKFVVRNRYMLLFDVIMCLAAYMVVIGMVFPISMVWDYYMHSLDVIAITAVAYCVGLAVFKVYFTDWIHAGVKEYLYLGISCLLSAIISIGVGILLKNEYFYPKINIAANIGTIGLVCASRLGMRGMYKIASITGRTDAKRILIVGAGRLAIMLLRDINENERLKYDVVGLIDDDVEKMKVHIHGASVIGTRDDIVRICKEKRVEEIIFAIFQITPKDKSDILDICSKSGCKIKILPGVEESLYGMNQLQKIREVEIEDLLERDPITLDNALIQNQIRDKVVLVTGGGGSIGSELCRQIIKYKPSRLIILDIYENTTYELQNELSENYPDQPLDVIIGSVRDKKRLEILFEKYRPEFVFHAAAHKHVPLMEFSPGEAIKNNVFGTYNVACCAEKYGVRRFTLISTDKAVNPTNVMGASKRMCEMIVQAMHKHSKTEFVAVRFGNVLGSNGSVIPRFKKQIASGGPVTVTHPEITRFFMTIPEAAQLVLQAAAYANGGEIFVLDMGQPVKIYDLASKMISLSGLKPNVDVKIEFTGLRPGEKLYEELLMSEEGLKDTVHSKIFVGTPIEISVNELNEKLEKLKNIDNFETQKIKQIMQEVVPTYKPENK